MVGEHRAFERSNQTGSDRGFDSLELAIGKPVGGTDWLLEGILGRGGTAVVLAVVKQPAGIKGAMKVPHLQWASRSELGVRFLEEAKLYTSLKHPHIVGVIDCGRLGSGLPFMVMERLRGRTLRAVMTAAHRSENRINPANAHEIALGLCDALHRLHSHRPEPVVHRDVKPENIFIHEVEGVPGLGTVKLLDLGLAGEPGLRRMVTMGTPRYMAPEQIRGDGVCEQTDQYALAVVLYEMLSGRAPWDIDSHDVGALAQMHVEKAPMPLIEVCSWVPKLVSDAIDVAMAKDPRDRWPSILQFADAVQGLSAAECRSEIGRTDWCITAPTLASLAAYQTGVPSVPEPIANAGDSPTGIDEFMQLTDLSSGIGYTSSVGSEEACSCASGDAVTAVETTAVTSPVRVRVGSPEDCRPESELGGRPKATWAMRLAVASGVSVVTFLVAVGVREVGVLRTSAKRRAGPPPVVMMKLSGTVSVETAGSARDAEWGLEPPAERVPAAPELPTSSPDTPLPRPGVSPVVGKVERGPPRKLSTSPPIDDGRELF
jgi:serine/threonine-protein kinase